MRPPGTWIGQVGDTPLMATYANVVGVVAGTSNLDFYGDPTLGSPYFSAATRNTTGRGVWTRVHPRTYDYMFVAAGLAADNSVVYQLKVWGTKTLGPHCGTMEVTATLDIFAPWQNAGVRLRVPCSIRCGATRGSARSCAR